MSRINLIFILALGFSEYSVAASRLELSTPDSLGQTQVMANILIDGRAAKLELDTGAAHTVLDNDEASKNYKIIGQADIDGVGWATYKCDLVRVNSMAFAGVNLPNRDLYRCEGLFAGAPGRLGIDLLDGKIVLLDFKMGEVDFLNEYSSHSCEVLRRLPEGHVVMTAMIAGKQTEVLFDTGTQATTIDNVYASAHPDIFTKIESKGRSFYTADSIQIGQILFKDVVLAGADFGDEVRKYLSPGVPIILGNNLITRVNWVLDLKDNCWRVRVD